MYWIWLSWSSFAPQQSSQRCALYWYLERCWLHTSVLATADQGWHRIGTVSPGGQDLGKGNNQESKPKLSKGTFHATWCLLRCKSIHYYNACPPEQLLYMLKACFPGSSWWEAENKAFVLLCFCAQTLLSSLLNCLYLYPWGFPILLLGTMDKSLDPSEDGHQRQPPFRYWQTLTRSPLSCLISGLSRPSCSLWERRSSPLILFAELCWTNSKSFWASLYWGAQNWILQVQPY